MFASVIQLYPILVFASKAQSPQLEWVPRKGQHSGRQQSCLKILRHRWN